jgi:predicted RNase H-like nuclease (RuvC/YqgF family)
LLPSRRKSVQTLRRSVQTLRKSVEMLRKSVEMLRKSVETLRKSVETLRRSVETLRKSVEICHHQRTEIGRMGRIGPIGFVERQSHLRGLLKKSLRQRAHLPQCLIALDQSYFLYAGFSIENSTG